jgi:hypothetical protein
MYIRFLSVEDILRERIRPHPDDTTPFKSFTVQRPKSAHQHESPRPPSPPPADETAIPIPTPPVLTPLPRIPTPPLPQASPPPEKPASPSLETPVTPSLEHPATPPPEQNIVQLPESPPPYIINYEKIRRGKYN